MPSQAAASFHTLHSLEAVLESVVKLEAQRHARLALPAALQQAIDHAGTDEKSLRAAVQQLSAELQQWQTFVAELQATADQWSIFQARQQRAGAAWWTQQFAALQLAFAQDAPAGAKQWIQIFTQALVDWDLPGCQKLVEETYPFPDALAFVPLMFEDGLQALRQSNPAGAEDMALFLVQPGTDSGQVSLEPAQQSAVLVLLGRIQTAKGDAAAALERFNQARDLAPAAGLPQAALGAYYTAQADYDQAATLLSDAVRLSPGEPEGYTGMALLMEARGLPDEAPAWYQQAVDCALLYPDPGGVLQRLNAPVSGNLFYYLAQAVREISGKSALQAVARALDMGLSGARPYPEVEAYLLQGELLRKTNKRLAAVAYTEAGSRSGWNSDYENAVPALKMARRLNPSNQRTCWFLAEDLRMLALARAPGEAQDALAQESLKVWETGAALGPIPRGDTWALVTRAAITENLPARRATPPHALALFTWESVFFVERALVRSATEVQNWFYAAKYYRALNLPATNGDAIDRGWELDHSDRLMWSEKLTRVVNYGDYETALQLLDPLPDDPDDGPWAHSVKGFLLSRSDRYAEALKLSEGFGSDDPNDNWTRFYRAFCYVKMHDIPAATRELRKVWDQTQNPNNIYLADYVGAGLYLALIAPGESPNLEQLIKLATQAADNSNNAFEGRMYWGYVLLAQGKNLPEARKIMEGAIPFATNTGDLKDHASFHIPMICDFMLTRPKGAAAMAILKDMQRALQDAREGMARRALSPEAELLREAERLESDHFSDVSSELALRAKLAPRAGLARLHLKAGRWTEAADGYRALKAHADIFPEAETGLRAALAGAKPPAA